MDKKSGFVIRDDFDLKIAQKLDSWNYILWFQKIFNYVICFDYGIVFKISKTSLYSY
jgi:hypothetical protein